MFFSSFKKSKSPPASSKRMLINVSQPEETRVAIIENGCLQDLSLETSKSEKTRGNIYKGKVQSVQHSLYAAFVDFGCGKPGFLPLDEVQPIYFSCKEQEKKRKLPADKILKKNQEVMVQVIKEAKGSKGALLTTYISIPGRYLVIMPGNTRSGVSKKIEDEAERKKLKDLVKELKLPETLGIIIRTAGLNKTKKELQRDTDYLLKLFKAIETKAKNITAPGLLYQESSIIIQAIRDYFTPDIAEVLIDSQDAFRQVKDFFKQVIPRHHKIVKLYEHTAPILSEYNIESQIDALYKRKVKLKSGGSISIDPTEALVSIDVNTAKFTSVKDPEESSLITNLEAADEIARQLRLRDLGGLIVIDFIDMRTVKNRQQLERHLKNAFKNDKANVEFSKISKFGLLEMSREHLRTTLAEETQVICCKCGGSGTLRSKLSLSMSILRIIQGKAASGSYCELKISTSSEVAGFLLNNKRTELAEIEKKYETAVLITSPCTSSEQVYTIDCVEKSKQEEIHD